MAHQSLNIAGVCVALLAMVWFVYATLDTSDDIVNCCGISHYPQPPLSNVSGAYSECAHLSYENVMVSDYSSFIFNTKHYHKVNWDSFGSMVTYYDINVTVSPITGGCILNDYDCFHDTVNECIFAEYPYNESFADNMSQQLQSQCQQSISKEAKLYVIAGILAVAAIKILLISMGICIKLCRDEFKPKNEALHNLKNPKLCPLFIEEHTNNAYQEMKDEEHADHHEYKLLYGGWVCIKYLLSLVVFLWKCCLWTLGTSYFLILYVLSFVCSIELFFVHNSPVLGVDGVDFCAKEEDEQASFCVIGQHQCGAVEWIILPHISSFFIPRFITLTVAYLACFGRMIEKCAVCKLQDMITKNDKRIIKDLRINRARTKQ